MVATAIGVVVRAVVALLRRMTLTEAVGVGGMMRRVVGGMVGGMGMMGGMGMVRVMRSVRGVGAV